jgi:hypothetical protein
MGSFNVSCGISGLPIDEGKRVGLVLIQINRDLTKMYPGDPADNCFRGRQYNATTDNYAPTFPAVYGTYNDYGSIENIEHGPETKVIEAYYGIPIEDVLKGVGDDWESEETQEEHPDNEAVKSLADTHNFFFIPEIFTEISQFLPKNNPYLYANKRRDISTHWDDFYAHYHEEENGRPKYWFAHNQPVMKFFENQTSFPLGLEKLEIFANDGMKEPVADLQKLGQVLSSVNRVYQPTFSGEQHGNWQVTELLNQLITPEIEESKKRFTSDWEDDE